ncbi:MAG: DUF6364 family protein [Candidatus Bathyarchaeota archaeon]
MRTRTVLSIEETVLNEARKKAEACNMSLSRYIENLLRKEMEK